MPWRLACQFGTDFFWKPHLLKGQKGSYLEFFFSQISEGDPLKHVFLFFCGEGPSPTPVKIVAWKMIPFFWEMDPFFWKGYSLVFPGGVCKAMTVGRHHHLHPKPGGSSIGNRCDADGGTTLAWRWRRHFCWRFKMGAPLGNSWLKLKLIEKTMRVFEKSFFFNLSNGYRFHT